MRKAVSALMILLGALGAAHSTSAAEIKVLAPGSLRSTMVDIISKYEKSSGNKVLIDYGTVRQLVDRIENGQLVDAVVMATGDLSELQTKGIVQGDTVPVAKVGIGVAVPKGARKPDVSSMASLKAALLAAKTVAHSDPSAGATGAHIAKAIEDLGIGTEMKPKIRLFPPGAALYAAVAEGKAEMAFSPIAEILSRNTIDFAGRIPTEIQRYNRFSAGIITTSNQKEQAGELIKLLTMPEVAAMLQSRGLEAP